MVVTHDPVLALMTDKRIVMKSGGMRQIVGTTPEEKSLSLKLNKIDELMLNLRDKVRNGEVIREIPIENIDFNLD
jgi:hypothetical protein